VRVMDEPIEDGVAKRRVADELVPVFDRDLTGHQRGPTASCLRSDFVITIERNARSASSEMRDQLPPKRVISLDRNG
jgi:hypothetical protein